MQKKLSNKSSLKKGNISSGKVTGSVNKIIDFDMIKDPDDCITDLSYEYYNSKFQFSDFYNKIVQDKDWIKKKPFLLESKKGVRYTNTKEGLELAFRHLVSMYQDLDTCLQRIHDGYHDSMFVRFAFASGIFTTQKHWEMLMRSWYRGWSMALRRYYNACHHKYDPTSGSSYVAYFDIHFSQYLYFAIGRADQDYQVPFTDLNYAENQYIRLDQLDQNHTSDWVHENLTVQLKDQADLILLPNLDQLSLSPISFQPISTMLGKM